MEKIYYTDKKGHEKHFEGDLTLGIMHDEQVVKTWFEGKEWIVKRSDIDGVWYLLHPYKYRG